MDILNGLLHAKCLKKNMTRTVSYILNSSVCAQFITTKINKKKKSELPTTVIYKRTDQNNKIITAKIKTL